MATIPPSAAEVNPNCPPMTFKTKAERSVQYNATAGALFVTVNGKEFGYYVDPLQSAWGRAFTLTKFRCQRVEGEPDSYDCVIDPANGNHSCECKGFLRHQRCKHVGALLALHQRGKI